MKSAILFLLFSVFEMSAVHAAGLCKAEEVTVFNCDLKENHKIVSICSSSDMSGKLGYLQYRYGKKDAIELVFPKNLDNSKDRFGCDEYSRSDLSTFVIGFENEGYRYEVSETTEGGDEGVTHRNLLVSSLSGKRGAKLTCLDNKNAVSNISTLDQVLKCDKKHEIVDGSCE
ncbi:hypothetical protein [Burkholderia gladioli]|uniref:hypothetical protein n=1 Tax=Burkholderia gladioli TaxID=28095 RepID=UPI0016402974|nr:hypothetical protein [Burkholderia gladioli]